MMNPIGWISVGRPLQRVVLFLVLALAWGEVSQSVVGGASQGGIPSDRFVD